MDRYSYDAADRLLSVQGGILGNRTYGYTGAGEVRTLSQGGATWTLDWDASGHPYHTDYGNGAYSASAVNGLGQRVFSRTADGQAHYTVAAGAEPGSPLLSDMTGGGAGRVYTPGVGQHDLSTNASRFSLVDALGGSRALLGADRSPLDDLRYDAWGGTIYHGGGSPAPVPLGWGSADGYQTDAWDSGLVLMGSRLYDGAVGRFLSPDPSGDGDNWYAYCGNDPVNASDPTGLTMQGAAPSGASFGDLGAQFGSGVGVSNDTYYQAYHVTLDVYSQTSTTTSWQEHGDPESITVTDPRQLVSSYQLGNDYSGYLQLSASQVLGYLGRNLRGDGKTDLKGGRAVAKSIFRHFTKGMKITQPPPRGGVLRRFPRGANN